MTLQLDVSPDLVRENASRVAEHCRAAGKRWCPRVASYCPPWAIAAILDSGAAGFTCTMVADAFRLLQMCGTSRIAELLVTQPVATPAVAQQVAELGQQTDVLATIDHFYHAELLSRAAANFGRRIAILIEVDVGRHQTGVRPGHDTCRLALAAAQLPGIRVAGLLADDAHVQQPDSTAGSAAFDEACRVARYCRDLIVRAGVPCAALCMGRSACLDSATRQPCVTHLRCGAVIWGDLLVTGVLPRAGLQPAVTLRTHVVSRPSLQQAVLLGGYSILGRCPLPPVVRSVRGASVSAVRADATVLRLSDAALDLTIGDPVELVVADAESALQRNGSAQQLRPLFPQT